MDSPTAAGGLVWRHSAAGPLVCLVHRPRRDDWTLPKGGIEPGEHPVEAAVREVGEEAGVQAVPEAPLPTVRYAQGGGPKVVAFWSMRPLPGQAPPVADAVADAEVDDVAWLPVTEARARLSYTSDVQVLATWTACAPVTGMVVVLRHADAGTRGRWPGSDGARALSLTGVAHARRMARLVTLFAPTGVVSASPRRCLQTVAPVAAARGLRVEIDRRFDEECGDPAAAAAQCRTLAAAGGVWVVCSQGAVIPPMVAQLAGRAGWSGAGWDAVRNTVSRGTVGRSGAGRDGAWATGKGEGWYLPFTGPRVLAAEPLRLAAGDDPTVR